MLVLSLDAARELAPGMDWAQLHAAGDAASAAASALIEALDLGGTELSVETIVRLRARINEYVAIHRVFHAAYMQSMRTLVMGLPQYVTAGIQYTPSVGADGVRGVTYS